MSQNSASAVVRLTQPGAGQTVVIPVDRASMRMGLEFMPDPNAVQKNGQNLEFNFEDGGKIVLEGYYDHFKTKTLPVMVTESGDELPGEDFLASLREDLLTAAGPGAGAGVGGSGAGEYADDPGALVDGVNRLGSLGTIYWGQDFEEPIRPDNVGLSLPPTLGDTSITVTTEVTGSILAGVFEDAKPFQHLGDYTDYLGQMHFNFDTGPNTSVTGLHLAGFPVGTEIYVGQPPVLYITIESADQILDLTAEHIAAGVFLRPPFDADFDIINITSTIDIVNETSGLTATVPGPSFNIVVDAVADKPIMSGEAGFSTPDVDGSIVVSESQSATQDMVDGWAVDTFDKSSSSVTTETSDVRISVDFHTTIRFGDYADGSETHYALVEVPSIGSWTPSVTSPAGVFPAVPPTITLYFDADGQCLGDAPVDGAVSSKEYFQFEVSNSLLQETGGIAELEINFVSSDANLTSDTKITLETGAMAVETPGDNELWDGNDKSYTFDRESGSGSGDSPNFIIDVVDSGLTVRVGWASEDNNNHQHTTGAYSPDYAGMNDPSDGRAGTLPGVDPGSTSANGAPIVISISGGDASGASTESMTSVKLFFNPAAGDIIVNGTVLTPVTGADGRTYVELTQANGGVNASGQTTGSVFFRPGVAHSDADVPMSYEVTVNSSSGASLTYSGNTVVVIDAVADLPTGVDSSFTGGGDNLTVSGAAGTVIAESDPGAGPDPETGWEVDSFGPGQGVNVGQTVSIRLSASFADVDGSEDHFILIQALPQGWTVNSASLAAAGLEATGRTITGEDGNTYTVYKIADGSLSQFDADITIGMVVPVSGSDQTFTIKTGAMAEERVDNPLEYDLMNNQAVVINDAPLTITVDAINSGLNINVGWASENNNDAKHLGLDSGGYAPAGLAQAGSTGVDGMDQNLGAPIVIALDPAAPGSGSPETITSVKLYYNPDAGEITVDGVALTGAEVHQDANGTYVVLTQANGGIDASGTGTGSVHFRPLDAGANHSDADTSVSYEVTVSNEAGASIVYTGSATVAIDAVADIAVFGQGDEAPKATYTGDHEAPGSGADTAAEPGEVVPVSGSITFPDTADGSEYHYIVVSVPENWTVPGMPSLMAEADVLGAYVQPTAGAQYTAGLDLPGDSDRLLVLEMPPVDAFTGGSYASANGVTITLSVAQGVATYSYSINGENIATITQDLATGKAEYEFNLKAPEFDDSAAVDIHGISVEQPSSLEYDYDNNVAVVSAETNVTCDAVTSYIKVSFSEFEDAMPYHFTKDGTTDQTVLGQGDSANTEIWIGGQPATQQQIDDYNTKGAPITIKVMDTDAGGDEIGGTDIVSSLTLTAIPDPSQGTLYYTDADGVTREITNADLNQAIEYPNIDGFSFKPAPNFSGDVTLNFDYTMKSPASGAEVESETIHGEDFGGWDLHVESVADVAGGGDITSVPDADGHLVMDQIGTGQADNAGWFTTQHGGDQSYTTEIKIPLNFMDLDGSETGVVYIPVVDGVTFPGLTTTNYNGQECWVISGKIDAADPSSPFVKDGAILDSITLTVVIDNQVNGQVSQPVIDAYIETRETGADPHNVTSNDVAVRELNGIELPTFDSSLVVKVGWAYEGDAGGDADGAKHGGNVSTPGALAGSLGGEHGVPVSVIFNAANGESMPNGDIYFTYDANAGEFYWNGTLIDPVGAVGPDGMATVKVSLSDFQNGKVTFKPTSSYSDEDINLSYEIVVKDETSTPGNEVTFKVKGETLVVMDAVADQAKIAAEVNAAVGENQDDGVILTIKTAFADNDTAATRSEGHYILVEARDGWECPEAGEPVLIWVDSNGQPVLPTGYDSASGAYSYPAGSVQKEFFQIDVTGKDPDADGNYAVIIKPKAGAEVTDLEDLVVGTMVAEENLSGEEYNYLNNIAYDVKTVDVQVVDSTLYAKEHVIHEENMPNAHVGSTETDSGKVLTLTIGKGVGGAQDGGEYLNSEGNIVITFTFEGTDAEAAAMMADGHFVIGDYTTTPADITDNGDGTFTLTVPANLTGLAGERVITVEYHPATDQDNDLSNVSVKVPVTNDTGYEETLTVDNLYIVVDAVADLPTGVSGGVTEIDNVDVSGGQDWKADWNSTVEIKVSAQFSDFKDGSEKHYLLLEAKEGWTCEDAGVITITLYYDKVTGNLLEPDGNGNYPPANVAYDSKVFFAKEATSFDADGNAATTFTVTTPENADATNDADAGNIMGDGSVSLITGGLAVEGAVDSNGVIDVTARETEGGQYGNTDGSYYNNIAFGQGSVSVDFNVINDGTGGTSGAYEDHKPWKNEGKFTGEEAVLKGDGSITITLDDPSGKDFIVENTATAQNVITFQYDNGKGGAPGDFTYTYDDNGVTKTGVISYPSGNYTQETAADGSVYYKVVIPDEAITADGRGVELTYNPPAYDNTDLANLEYVLNAKSENSKAEGPVTGGIVTDGFEDKGSTLIVDAVADKPTMTDFTEASYDNGAYVPGSVDYGTKVGSTDPAEAARPDQKVEVAVSVTFRDVEEGGEEHYIIIKNAGWTKCEGVDNVTYGAAGDIPGGLADGCTVINVTGLIDGVVSSWDGALPYSVEALPGLFVTLGKDASGAVTATVDTTIFVTVPGEAALKNALDNDEGSATIKLEVGGVAVDRDDTIPDGEHLTTANDVAVDWQDTLVKVEVVGSDIKLEVENGHIFENLTPNAHLDAADVAAWTQQLADYQNGVPGVTPPSGHSIVFVNKTTGEVLTEYKLANGAYVLKDSRNNVVSWNDVKVAEDDQYAIVKFSGLSDGETADITLTFSCPDGVTSAGKVHIIIDGVVVDSVEIVNGQAVISDFSAAKYGSQYSADSVIQFGVDPGDNYSHKDFTIGYDVTVTDNATGQTDNWSAAGDTSGLLVKVDAVAQRPEFEKTDGGDDVHQTTDKGFAHGGVDDKGDSDPDNDSYYREVEPGQPVYITTTLVFQDVSVDTGVNSSQHFVLVEAVAGSMCLPESVTLTWEGGSVTVPVSALTMQAYGDGMYYRIDVTSALQDVPMDANGKHTVEVTFQLSSDASSTDISLRVGAATHEVTATVQQDAESTLDNNTAFIVSDGIPITFGTRPTFSIGKAENWVSESDMSTANINGTWDQDGNFHAPADGGVLLGLNLGADCSLTSLSVNMSTVTGGTLYYLDASGVHGDISTYKAVPANGAVPADATALVFVPADNMLDTEDFIKDIQYSAEVKNDLTGQSGAFGGSITILVDAVAQKPMVESVEFEDGSSLSSGIVINHQTNAGVGADNTQRTDTITIQGKFADTADGSEMHYALIKVVGNMTVVYDDGSGKPASDWPTCTETFLYNGELYYKVPMADGESVDVQLVFLSHKLTAEGHASDTISFLVMTEEQVVDGVNGNRENNYDNNIAISDAGPDLTITHDWPGGDIIWIDPNYENNTPNAHEEEESDDMTFDDKGGKIHFGANVDHFEITVHEAVGAIYVRDLNGDLVKLTGTDDGSGNITYTVPNDGNEYHFKPTPEYKDLGEFNYDDVDPNIYYTAYNDQSQVIGGGNGASFPAVVDAVAQLPVADVSTADYDPATPGTVNDRYTAVGDSGNGGNEGEVVISIGSSEFKDSDGSETHYALLRKDGNYDIVDSGGLNVDTVYLPDEDGNLQAYWRVEIPAGQDSVDVTVKVHPDAFDQNREYSVQTGLMSEEKNYGGIVDGKVDAEVEVGNNISYVWGDKVTVYYSPVETTVSIEVKDTWENDENGTGGAITVKVALGADDVLNSLTLTVPAGVDGQVVMGSGETVIGQAGDAIDLAGLLGAGVLDAILAKTAADYSINTTGMSELEAAKALADAMSSEINNELSALGLRFKTSGYGDTDLPEFVVTAEVSDSRSGDTATKTAGDGAIVDAVAHAPDFGQDGVKTGAVDANGNLIDGITAAESGQTLTAVVDLKFEDIGSGEEHYAILSQHHNWPVTEVRWQQDGEWHEGTVVTFFDSSGKPYYALKIEDGMFESGSDSIKVAFDVQAPTSETDLSQTIKIGGASVETNMGAPSDKELDLLNNWSENVQDVTLTVGVVETTGASMEIGSGARYEDTAAQLTFTLTGGNNDSIQSVIIADLKGGTIGIMDNGVYVPLFSGSGSVTLDGAVAQAGGYYYMPAQDWSGNMSLGYQVTVQDNASGATKTFPTSGGNSTASATFIAVADQPTDVSTDAVVDYNPATPGVQPADPTAAAPGGKVSFEVSATFGDYLDGSERHYILVEAKSGWVCTNAGATTSGGYFRIPVSNTDIANGGGSVTVTVTMTAPGSLTADNSVEFKVGALSVDGTSTAQTLADDKISVEIGAVETTAATITAQTGSVSEDALGAAGSVITISLDKGLEYNEEIAGVKVLNLNGGKIWDTQANGGAGGYLTGSQPVLDADGAQNGRYVYEPKANVGGNVKLDFEVTVKDTASGATKSIQDSATVFVTPVTDTPDDLAAGAGATTVKAGHTATVTVTLQADFTDYDGSEEHFFLVKLPAGASLPGGVEASDAVKLAAGMDVTDTVYRVNVSSAAGKSVSLTLSLDSSYANGAIEYTAGSVEKAIAGKYAGGEYEFSDTGSYVVNADSGTFNTAPTLSAPSGNSVNIVRGDTVTGGQIAMTDNDGDDVAITGVKAGAGAGGFTAVPDGGSTTVNGVYGSLTVNADGSYSYKLYDQGDPLYTAPVAGAVETFTVQGTDDYAGTAMSGTAQITVTLTDQNAVPQPVSAVQYGVSGNVNAEDLTATTGLYRTTDADGDTVSITGFSLGGRDAVTTDGGRTWVLEGEFGTMTMDSEGNYTYIRSAAGEYLTGSESFTVHFTDGIASNSGELRITAAPVNHAPETENTLVRYDNNSATSMRGMLTFSDVDSDAVRVASVIVGGTTYSVTQETWTTGIITDGFTLKISPEGYYSFTWSKDWTEGTEHSFTYTVTDGSSVGDTPLDATGTLSFVKVDDVTNVQQGFMSVFGESADISSGLEGLGIGQDSDSQDEGLSFSALTVGYQLAEGAEGEGEESGQSSVEDAAATGVLFEATGHEGALGSSSVDDVLDWTHGDLTVGGTETILDFSLGEDKLFLEQLFGDMEASSLQSALTDKLDSGLLDISVNADGSQVQVAMDGQVVDIHLTENLGSAVIEGINNADSSAKAALLEMMITQVTG